MTKTETEWDTDIAKARDLLDGQGPMPADEGTIYTFAAAIADARADGVEKTVQRFAELADEIDANARLRDGNDYLIYPARDRRPMHECADAIRRVVREIA